MAVNVKCRADGMCECASCNMHTNAFCTENNESVFETTSNEELMKPFAHFDDLQLSD